VGTARSTRDSDTEDERIAELLRQSAVLVLRHLSDRDLSITAVDVLDRLAQHGPTRLTALAAAEGITQPSMTQLAQRLERQGLVTRVGDAQDGRAVVVAVTDAGRALLAQRRRARVARLSTLLETVSTDDRRALANAARDILPVIERLVANAVDPDRVAIVGR
jgi:DNA-binding MarR family transcriptional regulator